MSKTTTTGKGPKGGKRAQTAKTEQEKEEREARKQALVAQADVALDALVADMSAEEFERKMGERTALLAQLWRYSLNNQWLIATQLAQRARTPSYVAGFNFWLRHNRVPRKGTALYILRPHRIKLEDETTGEVRYGLRGFGTTTVFDYGDTYVLEGKEDKAAALFMPWTEVKGDYDDLLVRLTGVVVRLGIAVYRTDLPEGTNGTSNGQGTIELSTRISGAQLCKTLLHELAHELVHKNRDGLAYSDNAAYRAQLECQADSIAYAVAGALGLEWPNTPSYLALHGVTKEVLKANLDAIKDGVQVVLAAVLGSGDDEKGADAEVAA